ncbi:MAG: hypothetical protein H6Q73_305 [Firmicutes bacterium]|nr:hypothetical protein [Bacillota bacterium]
MIKRRISISFCGGCNPRIDRKRIAEEVEDYLTPDGYIVVYNSAEVDLIVYLSGCSANCAHRYSGSDTPGVVVAGNTLNAMAVTAEELSFLISGKVSDYFEQLEKSLSR